MQSQVQTPEQSIFGRLEGFAWNSQSKAFNCYVRVCQVGSTIPGCPAGLEDNYYLTDDTMVVGLKTIQPTTVDYHGYYQKSKHKKDHPSGSSAPNTISYLKQDFPPLLYQSYTSPVVPCGLPVLRLWLNIYVDAFGALNRVYHSTAGVYFSLGNMPRTERLKIENMHMIGLAEPCKMVC